MANRDLYAILGLSRNASDADIKKAYRKLARELHPDRNPNDRQAEERFKDVGHAYQVLSDPQKRKLYDEFGDLGLKEGFDPNAYRQQQQAWRQAEPGAGGAFFDLEDLFAGAGGAGGARGTSFGFDLEDLFGAVGGGGRRRRGAQPTKAPDAQAEITIGFVEALQGCEKELSLSRPDMANGHRTLRVRIPPGVKDEGKVRLRGQGVAAGGAERGDLVLTVHVEPHPYFWREGDDLHVTLPVTLLEAYRGAKVPVPTPDGTVTLTVPPGTQSDAKLRARGKGAPQRGGGAGDLIVHVRPQLPREHNSRVERALEDVEQVYRGDVRAGLRL